MPSVVVFDEFGGPEVLHVVDEPVADPGPGEVRIRIEAFAVNPLDTMTRSGSSPGHVVLPHARLGVEGTSVVDAVGADVRDLRVGDPVVLAAVPDATARGSYAQYTTAPVGRVFRRPAELTVPEAAAVWVGFSTAYGALVETARMRPGDRVLITAAAGAVGRAAIQVAAHLGAVPIAVVRHAGKRDELLAAGAAAVIVTDEQDLTTTVAELTDGAGVDIVLDLVAGPGIVELAAAARPGGTLLTAGFLDLRPAPFPFAPLTFVRYRSFEHTLDPAAVRRMAAFLAAGVRVGAFRPVIDGVVGLDDVREAHRRLDSGQHSGKIVVTVDR
jgi:NADPH:quinone reductase-like Zn-dependent oxidoreductase